MLKLKAMNSVRLLCLLSAFVVAGCSQQAGFLASYAERNPAPAERMNPGTAPPDKWTPAPDETPDDEFLPNTERISKLPRKVGECFETTITEITDRYGEDIPPRPKKGPDPGTIVRFSNSGVQVSLHREKTIVNSQVFDKVNMCLVQLPQQCPGDLRGRIYRTTNLRTNESWSLANDITSCGGPAG